MKSIKLLSVFKKLLILIFCLGCFGKNYGQTTIAVQPISQIVCPSTNAAPTTCTFSVTAAGGATTFKYQWNFNDNPRLGDTSRTLTFNVTAASAGKYSVKVIGTRSTINIDLTTTTKTDTATSSNAYLNFIITTPPKSASIARGYSNTFSIGVNDGDNSITPNYQWNRNDTAITSGIQSTYVDSLKAIYKVILFNVDKTCSIITSDKVQLTYQDTFYFNKLDGNINVLANWDTTGNGSGSIPKNFTTTTNIFNLTRNAVTNGTNISAVSPIASTNFTMAGTLNLLSGNLEISNGDTLTIDNITHADKGTTPAAGALSGHYNSSLSIKGTTSNLYFKDSAILQNLTIGSSVSTTLNTPLSIAPSGVVVDTSSSGGSLVTNNNLTLKSDATGTAAIGNSSGTISGKVTIERYIPARRAWRLITAPVSSSGAPTINESWQEGQTSKDPTSPLNKFSGFGAPVSGGITANGFDTASRFNAAIKYYDSSKFIGISSTNINITDHNGYFFFIRGNRSYNLINATPSTTATATTLRATGNIRQGTTLTYLAANNTYFLVGNPYACPIDFDNVYKSNTSTIMQQFYYWNPQIGGTYGLGAYVLVSYDGKGYTSTPVVTNPTTTAGGNIIQSGQAIFIQRTTQYVDQTLPIIFNEGHKSQSSPSSTMPFGRLATKATGREAGLGDASISVDLNIVNADNTLSVADGILAHYNDIYSNAVNNEDAAKFYNGSENMFIANPALALILERRQMPIAGDTLKINITNFKNTNYLLKINSDFLYTGFQTQLVDKFLSKTLNISDTASYPFSITSDANSAATNRFSIVFNPIAVLPIKFISVNAILLNKDSIALNWKVAEDATTIQYEVQRLNENNIYTTVGKLYASTNGSLNGYHFNDIAQNAGTIFYRIKAISTNGEAYYSAVVSVKTKSTKEGISIWPNPVNGNTIKLAMQNIKAGKYAYTIINNAGQAISSGTINHMANQQIETVNLNEMVAEGNYIFYLNQGNSSYQTKLVIVKAK